MTPEILALDYYDGALEGFGRRILDGRDAYFRLIAWDLQQDERLFAAVVLPSGMVDRVFALFSKTDRMPESRAWLPEGRLEDAADNVEVDALIAQARERMPSEGMLLAAKQIGATPRVLRRIDATERTRLEQVLSRRTPDPISEWLR